MAIRIITDSAADYTQAEIEKRKIICVPMSVEIDGEHYLDGVDLSKEEFYEKLTASKEIPKTSQPSPAFFLEQFEEAKEAGDTVIAILIAGKLSGTRQSAELAKSMAEYDEIYIIDSQTVTLGMRILIDRAAVMREKGASVGEIIEEVEGLRDRIHVYAGLDTLEYLSKGGRLSKSQAVIGNLVSLKPVISIGTEGEVELVGKQIGLRHVYKYMSRMVKDNLPDPDYPVYFLYTSEKKNCVDFIRALQKNGMDYGTAKMREVGSTVGTHIGPGGFGIAYVAAVQNQEKM